MTYEVSSEIFEQIKLLGEAFCLGVILMTLYDVIRLLRHMIRHHSIIVAIEDLLFWMIASACIFYLLYLENSGRVRMYAIGGTALGMVLYYLLWGRHWMRWLDKGLGFVKKSWFFHKKG